MAASTKSYIKYELSGTAQSQFPFEFPYFNVSDITVELPPDYTGTYTINASTDTVELSYPISVGTVLIRRHTPQAVKHIFANMMRFNFKAVDENFKQCLYWFQEALDSIDFTSAGATTTRINEVEAEAASWVAAEAAARNTAISSERVAWQQGDTDLAQQLTTTLAASTGATLIGFMQSGAGAVKRPASDKMRDFASVLDFGADPLGVIAADSAFSAAFAASRYVVVPEFATVRLAGYVNIPSNTTLLILGNVALTNKVAGFYSSGAANITVDGSGVGAVYDSGIKSNYIWNQHQIGPDTRYVPAFHFRGSENCHVRNLNLKYLTIGVWFSNASANSFSGPGTVALSGAGCSNCSVSDVHSTYIEGAAMQATDSARVVFRNNYVYRSGDGGIWFMGCRESDILNNTRESPYGAGNDYQGICIEHGAGGRVAGNKVVGFAHYGIDIKNNSQRVVVEHNEVVDCETASIVVRPGDSVQNPNFSISIRNNRIKNNGYPHTGAPVSFNAAICSDSCFQTDISDNEINGYKVGAAICVTGPGAYYASNYAGNPAQSTCVVKRNCITFKTIGIFADDAYELSATTPGAILVSGLHNSVVIRDNKVFADRFLASDSRVNTSVQAIYAAYSNTPIASVAIWPQQMEVSGNDIARWHGGGIKVVGVGASIDHGLSIRGNAISYTCAEGIYVDQAGEVAITGNSVIGSGSGGGHANISVSNSNNVTCTCNTSKPRSTGGTSSTTWAARYLTCATVLSVSNRFAYCASGTVDTTGSSGVVTAGNI